MTDQLRVVSVQVRDVLGIEEAAIEPGSITKITGRNGSTKTSLLQALEQTLKGGALARLARVDPEGKETEPEVVLVLEGAGAEAYRVERKGDKVRVRRRVGDSAAFEDVPRPQGWLTSLFDGAGANPVRFLMAKDDERATMLLEALPLTMPRDELAGILRGVDAGDIPHVPAGLHPLEELALVRDAVFRARTGVNRDTDGKRKAAEQVRRTAPAVVPDDPADAIAQQETACRTLEATGEREAEAARAAEREAVAAARTRHELAEQGIKSSFTEAVREIRASHDRKAAELRAEVERQIDADRQAMEAAISGLRESDEKRLEELDAARDRALDAARVAREQAEGKLDGMRRELAGGRERLAKLRAQAREHDQAASLHAQAKQFDEEAASLALKADGLTSVLEQLDALRRRLAKDLPIPGLEIEGRQIRVSGVPYEQLNTAQRVAIAVEVACLRAQGQRLPIVFVDGAEALDTEHFGILAERLRAAGVQAFIGRVEDHELKVEVA